MSIFSKILVPWFVITVFYIFQYILRVLPNVGMPHIAEHFGVHASEIGWFSSCYYIGYTLFHIPLGIAIDRYEVRKVISICIFGTVLGLVPLVHGEYFASAVWGRLLTGIASSSAILGLIKVSRSFGAKGFASMLGISATFGILGAICGGGPVNFLISAYGWEAVVNAFILFGCILAIFSYFTLVDVQKTEKPLSLRDTWLGVKKILKTKEVTALSLIGGLMVGSVEGFADVWGTLFFESFYSLDRGHATTLSSMIFFGMCLGSAPVGYLFDRTRSHVGIMISACFGLLATLCLIFSGLCSLKVLYFITFLVGIFSAYQIALFGALPQYVDEKMSNLASAAMNMFVMVFGALFHGAIGELMSVYGEAEVQTSVSVMESLMVIPGAVFLALILLLVFLYKKVL